MKTIGMIGGMSWESTVLYYQIINKVVKEQLGGFHSAKCLLYSVDFHEIEECQSNDDWARSADILAKAACDLEKAGADFIIICTNTMHKVVNEIKEAIHIPILHIAELTADVLVSCGITKVALLGTKYTMEQDFYKSKLVEKGIEVIVPDADGRKKVNSIIYDELCMGIVNDNSKHTFLKLIDEFARKGAQGVILGCTEIGMLVKQADTEMPLYDTTFIHALKAAQYSMN